MQKSIFSFIAYIKTMTIEQIASQIAFNNKGEQDAIENYFTMVDAARKNNLPKDFIDDLHEIIADEMNHSEKLSHWVTRFTGIKPAST